MAIKGFSELTLINLENIFYLETLWQYEFCLLKYNPFVEGELLTVLSKKRGDFFTSTSTRGKP